MRRVAIVLIVLALLAAVVDRVAVHQAEQVIAERVQATQRLDAPPEVTVHGFPFLTQALSGRYRQIEAAVPDLAVPDARSGSADGASALRLEAVSVKLSDVRVPMRALASGEVGAVPVGRAEAGARLDYDVLERLLGVADGRLAVELGPGRAADRVSFRGTLTTAVGSTAVSGELSLRVRGDRLAVALVPGSVAELPDLVVDELARRLVLSQRLPELPFGLRVTRVRADSRGVGVQAAADDVTLG